MFLAWKEKSIHEGDLIKVSSAVKNMLFFSPNSCCSRSLLVVCFGASAMVAENLQCGFLSCHSGVSNETVFLFRFVCVCMYV